MNERKRKEKNTLNAPKLVLYGYFSLLFLVPVVVFAIACAVQNRKSLFKLGYNDFGIYAGMGTIESAAVYQPTLEFYHHQIKFSFD